jgi:hypothetical protein
MRSTHLLERPFAGAACWQHDHLVSSDAKGVDVMSQQGMLDANPAKLGVDNSSPRRRPFESWVQLEAIVANLSARYRSTSTTT